PPMTLKPSRRNWSWSSPRLLATFSNRITPSCPAERIPSSSRRHHHVAERQRFRNDPVGAGTHVEMARKALQHGPMHALARAAPHLVPVIARHFELRLLRYLHL